jgi:hypothetical protein
MNATAILRRCVVGHCDTGIYLTYHDMPLACDERELLNESPREFVNDSGLAKLLHGEMVVFTQNDQSYPRLAAAFC